MFMSLSFFMTLATDISKSSWVTWMRRSLSANIPASVHTACFRRQNAKHIGGFHEKKKKGKGEGVRKTPPTNRNSAPIVLAEEMDTFSSAQVSGPG